MWGVLVINKLFVSWQNTDTREWVPVGVLVREHSGGYLFAYTRGVLKARPSFSFGGMRERGVVYRSDELFPLFSNRLLDRSRPEYAEYVDWLGLTPDAVDPLQVLSLTEGCVVLTI